MSSVLIAGDTSGSITLSAPAVSGSSVLTLPVATDTLVGKATTDTLTNKSIAVTQLTGTLAEANGGTGTTTGYYGFKNRIINGAMTTDQRNAAASQTFTAAGALAYSVDRFYGYCTGANVTGQQVAGSTTPTNTQFRYKFTGAASVTAVGFGQRIEQKNSYDLAGSTCTLSADLAISATLTTVTWTAYYATTTADTFGSLASPTVTQIATGTFTVSATVTHFSTNISVPAAATTGIQILFTVGALTAGLTWTIGNVQLEKGSAATSFDLRPYGTELALCQRYYAENKGEIWGAPANGTANIQWGGALYPVPMRASPTIVFYGNGTANSLRSSGGATITLVSPSPGVSDKGVSYLNVSSGLTGGTWYQAGYTATAEL